MRTIALQLRRFDEPSIAWQLVGNIALLLPFGIALPILWPTLRRPLRVVVTVVSLGVAVEAAQVVIDLAAGAMVRSLDIDDAILNGAGVAIGFAIWWVARRLGEPLIAGPVRPPVGTAPRPAPDQR
jgi:glycopeptide antibiotics resistance protein